MSFSGFRPESFAFYGELAQNNNRDWWLANKARYETEVREPILALLEELAPEFGACKLYRPYRDTRFSGNKDPYKENAAVSVFGPGSTGLYLELNANGLDFGGGYWLPGKDQLTRFREIIDDVRLHGDLEATIEELAEDDFELYRADALKRMPRGYPIDHPRIELLRLQHMVMFKVVPPSQWMFGPEAAEILAEQWRKVQVWNEWLAEAIGPSSQPRTR
jgi:uncharacterized protein (TIGR02453 family)